MATNEVFDTLTSKWNPPIPSDDSQYSFNSVKQSKSGHVFEVDDTPGNERIAEHHKSGTSKTIIADGTSHITIVGDSFVTVIRNGHMHIMGDVDVTMEKTVRLHCKKLEVEATEMHTTVHGDYSLHIDGNYLLEVVGDVSEKIAGGKKFECGKDFAPIIHGNILETIGKDYTSTMGSYNMMATSNASITGGLLGTSISSAGNLKLNGTRVGISSVLDCDITALGMINMIAPELSIDSPLTTAWGFIDCVDIASNATGITTTLSTHLHTSSVPGTPTSPPVL